MRYDKVSHHGDIYSVAVKTPEGDTVSVCGDARQHVINAASWIRTGELVVSAAQAAPEGAA